MKNNIVTNKVQTTELTINQKKSKLTEKIAISWLKTKMGNKLSPEQTREFLSICIYQGLNPFKREIYAIPYKTKNEQGKYISQLTIVTGYEVYIKRVLASPVFGGVRFTYDLTNKLDPIITCILTRLRKENNETIKIEMEHMVIFSEVAKYVDKWENHQKVGKVLTSFWQKSPLFMLKKVAYSQALRLYFGDVIDGLPISDVEIMTEQVKDITPEEPSEEQLEGINSEEFNSELETQIERRNPPKVSQEENAKIFNETSKDKLPQEILDQIQENEEKLKRNFNLT